jgi:ribonuclease-3
VTAADPQELEARLNHSFQQKELLVRALTHKSFAFENRDENDSPAPDNEQLEFLGDSILGFIVSEALMARYPDYSEGDLSRLKAHLVSAAHLHPVAAGLGVGAYLRLGRSEEVGGGRKKKALLANAMEALIAALYLDGGLDVARTFILDHVIGSGDSADSQDSEAAISYKTVLQERARSMKLPQPRYVVAAENGPEHSKTFVVEVHVGENFLGRGEGPSKKAAGQLAAKGVLDQMTEAVDGRNRTAGPFADGRR